MVPPHWSLAVRPCPRWTARNMLRPPALPREATCLADAEGGKPDVILLATGSELQWVVARVRKTESGRHQGPGRQHALLGIVRPARCCLQRIVLPSSVTARVSVEMACTFRLGTLRRPARVRSIGMHSFGASAPLKDLLKKFGFDAGTRCHSRKRTAWKVSTNENCHWLRSRRFSIEECHG